MFWNYLRIFLISMLPLAELRGAIPVSRALNMPVIPSYIVCVLGNLILMPFVYLFAERFLRWGKDKKVVGRFCRWCLRRGKKAGDKLNKKAGRTSLFFALMLFVGIPLPGTGAWTGVLAASFIEMGFKSTIAAISLGVLLAGAIMMTASYYGLGLI